MSLLPSPAHAKGFGVLKGKCILDFVRHWRTQDPYPLAAVGIALAFFYIKIGGENLCVLQFLRGYGGKCRSHTIYFWYNERWTLSKRKNSIMDKTR